MPGRSGFVWLMKELVSVLCAYEMASGEKRGDVLEDICCVVHALSFASAKSIIANAFFFAGEISNRLHRSTARQNRKVDNVVKMTQIKGGRPHECNHSCGI